MPTSPEHLTPQDHPNHSLYPIPHEPTLNLGDSTPPPMALSRETEHDNPGIVYDRGSFDQLDDSGTGSPEEPTAPPMPPLPLPIPVALPTALVDPAAVWERASTRAAGVVGAEASGDNEADESFVAGETGHNHADDMPSPPVAGGTPPGEPPVPPIDSVPTSFPEDGPEGQEPSDKTPLDATSGFQELDSTVNLTSAEITHRCIDEVKREIERTVADTRAGVEGNYTVFDVVPIVSDMAVEAAKQGDIAQADAHLDTVTELSPILTHGYARTCFAAISAGSSHAFDSLRDALGKERLKNVQAIEARQSEHPHTFYPFLRDELLQEVIEVCGEIGTPPESWIEEFAVDEEYGWKLTRGYYHAQYEAAKGTPEALDHKQRLESLANEFLDPDRFDDPFIFDEARETLEAASDPELRDRIVERFIESGGGVLITDNSFYELVRMGSAVVSDSELATPRNIEMFEGAIAHAVQHLQDAGTSEYELLDGQMEWNLDLAAHRGATPSDIIRTLDGQITKLLNADVSNTGTNINPFNRGDVTAMRRDDILGDYAARYAEHGDLESAKLFLGNIENENKREYVLEACLNETLTQEQFEAIKPDDMELALKPGLATHAKFTEARISGDMGGLENLARELAATIGESDDLRGERFLRQNYILDTYKTIASLDAQRGPALAKELLATLRGQEVIYHANTISYLSDRLIEAGDMEEIRNAYADVAHNAPNSSQRLRYLWDLAKKLEP